MSTHPEPVKVITHYGLTRDEYASKIGMHPSCLENRLRPLCNNGSYHAKCVRDAAAVDCPVCLERLK